MKIKTIDIISLGWNKYNSFHFYILEINYNSLIGINFSFKGYSFLYIDLFWHSIKIFDKSDR